MKKLILFVLALSLIAAPAMADCVASQYQLAYGGSQLIIKLACTGSAVDGSVADLDLDDSALSAGLPKSYWAMGFYLYEVWTVAGAAPNAPDAADITITDALGAELYDEDNVLQAAGTTAGTVPKARAVNSALTTAHANQSTASATWDTYIKMVR